MNSEHQRLDERWSGGENAHTPFIFITAHDDSGARAEAEAVGCPACFQKTDSGAHVLEAIRRVAA